ncbi:helix-turn-helix domain-containing protein [Dongshaea marina]|uniref:helix-turn-helix domain-containing protein n=1 Tax=Dongshaea marina TaxID=2047966 RepID=UPI000D3E5431|nr:helix-turn-helix domain-containing protein [Dongshaea marina]
MSQPTETANKIKDFRLQRGWSQEQLAEISGVSVRTISRLEQGGKGSLESLRALASAFEVEIATLYPQQQAPHSEQQIAQVRDTALEQEIKDIRHFHSHLLKYLLVNLGLFIGGFWQPGLWWSLPWTLLFWGAFLSWHGLAAYRKLDKLTRRWEHYLLSRRLKNKQKK